MGKIISIAIIVGSLRKESFSRKIAEAVVNLHVQDVDFSFLEVGDLPLYNEDLETAPPKAWKDLRTTLPYYDAILFVTPEYNRSIPAALKNALDVGSRPRGFNSWNRLPAAIISCTPGSLGAFGANHHLRQCLVFLNMPCLQQPEAYIGHANQLVNQDGFFESESTAKFFTSFIAAFKEWIQTVGKNI